MSDTPSDLDLCGSENVASFSRACLAGLMRPLVRRHQSLVPRLQYFVLSLMLAVAEMYLISIAFEFTFGRHPWRV